MVEVNVVGEGVLDLAVASKILGYLGHTVSRSYDRRGKNKIDEKILGYNAAAAFEHWLVLRDQDQDAPCPGALREHLLPSAQQSRYMQLRIVERSIEAWLLADSAGIAELLGISQALVLATPVQIIQDPKIFFISLARRSRLKNIREAIVPREGSGRTIGPEYNLILQEFTAASWNPDTASLSHSGISKAISRISEW